ncbi:MAG: hypothetical protein F6K00_30010 [Leptolyngbya sp. SIOISBB]|nr:hypothetical protein [Leptolyngbya sp. SIOISBB]
MKRFILTALFLPVTLAGNAQAQVLPAQQVTFESLLGPRTPGGFTLPPEITGLLGSDDLSRTWTGTETLSDVLWLGDLHGSLAPGQFTLNRISTLTGLDLETVSLDSLALLEWQTLGDLVTAMPGLASVQSGSVPVVRDVLTSSGPPTNNQARLGDLVQSPSVAALPLASVDLSAYNLSDLTGLADTPLQNFRDFERTPLSGVPGLSSVPLDQFPGAVNLPAPTPAIVDIVFSDAEGDIQRAISGSYEEGFAVPCQTNCAHIELGAPFEGAQWISGLSQQVRGGHGVLGQVNNGLEPTGRHPFGDAFKVAVLETDEATGTAETGLFFRFCIERQFLDLGCTPYFIGPVPWLPVSEEGLALL